MPIANTRERYGTAAIALHWTMAAILAALVAIGLYMVQLPDVGFDTRKITLILFHKELGILGLALVGLRFAWRIGNRLPLLVATLPDWQKVVARLVHLSLYALMFALPVTGWLMSSATGIPVSLFGLFDLPDLIGYDDYRFHVLITVHKWLSYALIAVVIVHSGAALRHHWLFRDDTLRRMLP